MRNCPHCDQRGRKISAITLSNQVQPDRLKDIEERDDWLLCLSSTCSTVYFRETEVVETPDLKMLPFHKDTSPERLVCFCFEHRANVIREEVLTQGQSTVQASIKAACKSGKDDCERMNPQGRCCLGNVGLVIKDARGVDPESSQPNETDCCKDKATADHT